MKKLILTVALAASGLGGLASSAQAHEGERCGREYRGCYSERGCYNDGFYFGYPENNGCEYYWEHGCRVYRQPRHCR